MSFKFAAKVCLVLAFGFGLDGPKLCSGQDLGVIPGTDVTSWMKVAAHYRSGIEALTSANFNPNSNELYGRGRLRMDMALTDPDDRIGFYLQVQDSRVIGLAGGASRADLRDPFDFQQAYWELKPASGSAFSLRLGRQEMPLGSGSLVGDAGWGNTGGVFDAAKLNWNRHGLSFTLFAASPIVPSVSNLDWHDPHQWLYGSYVTIPSRSERLSVDVYLLDKHVTQHALVVGSNIYVPGVRVSGRFSSGMDYSAELTRQWGDKGLLPVRAWGAHLNAGYTFQRLFLQPRLSTGFDYASGSHQDGRFGTFDQLYPGLHGLYGVADLFGFQNLEDFRSGFDLHPRNNLTIAVQDHALRLATGSDGLYGPSGALLVAAPGQSRFGRNIGNEIDITGAYQAVTHWQLGLGFGHLFTSDYLHAATRANAVSFPYVYSDISF